MDERFTQQGDSMLCAVKELVQIMKEDSQAVDVDRDLSSGQHGRIAKLEAEQRNLAVKVQEIKKVAQSTAENVAVVLQLLQQGGSMGMGSASGKLPKEQLRIDWVARCIVLVDLKRKWDSEGGIWKLC